MPTMHFMLNKYKRLPRYLHLGNPFQNFVKMLLLDLL